MSSMKWSVKDVEHWLANTLMLDKQVIKIFEENEINGEILLNHITDNILLTRLGILSYNSRFKILNGIQALKLENEGPQIVPLILPTSSSFIFDPIVNDMNDRVSNNTEDNTTVNFDLSDDEASEAISSDSNKDFANGSDEDDDYSDRESFLSENEDSDALVMDNEGDLIMRGQRIKKNKKFHLKTMDSYEFGNKPELLSNFHAIRIGKDPISKKEEERILASQKKFGYATKWMYAEDDELLPVYGDSDEELYYLTSDFEEEIMEEERKLSKREGKKSTPFIYVGSEGKSSPSINENISSEDEESFELKKGKDGIPQSKKPQLEDKAYYYWSKYFPRKSSTKNTTRLATLQKSLQHLRNERLPQLVEQVKSNLNTVKELTLEKSSVRRACGALETTLHQVFVFEWILALLVRPEVPQKSARTSKKKKIVKNENSNEVTDDYEEYDSDFIDDSEPVDTNTYNLEWAELYRIPNLTVETMKLPDLPEVTRVISNDVACVNSEKSRHDSSESNALEKNITSPNNINVPLVKDDNIIISKESPDVKISDSDDSSDKKPLSEEITFVPIVENSSRKPNPSEIIVVEDSDVEITSDMEIDDDKTESYQASVINNLAHSVSKVNIIPDFDYIDDDDVYEEPVQMHSKIDTTFLKYKCQELYDKIIALSEQLAFNCNQKLEDQAVLIRIYDEFRRYLHMLCRKGGKNSKLKQLNISNIDVFSKYYDWRRNYVMENHNKKHAEIEVKNESHVGKNYVGDSEEESDDLDRGECSSPKKSKRRKKVKESKTVIEQRKARSMLEQDYRARFEMQAKLVNPSEGVIINLGHHEDEEHIFIPDIGNKLKPHQIEGVRFLWKNIIMFNKGCVLAHSMGLGKTFQVITFLFTLAYHIRGYSNNTVIPDHLKKFQILILCPKIVVDNWENEFNYWLKDVSKIFSFYKFNDNVDQRQKTIITWFENGGVLLVGYEMYRQLICTNSPHQGFYRHCLLEPGPSLIVADEGHILKTKDTKLNEVLKNLKTPSRIILTGSPLQNNLVEYWCMIQFVCPNYLGELEDFKKVYMQPIQNGLYKQVELAEEKLSRKMLYVLGNIIEDIVHRRNLGILEKDLPTKVEYLVACRIQGRQLYIYSELVDALNKEGGPNIQYSHLLGVLCNHPAIVLPKLSKENKVKEKIVIDLTGDDGEVNAIDDDNLPTTIRESIYKIVSEMKELDEIYESCKMLVLMKILEKCEAKKDKVLIFSKSIPTLDFIEKLLKKWKPDNDSHFMRIDGNTASASRQIKIKDFNETKLWRVALISIKTAALGVNLVGANRVILVDGEWNPSHAEQAIGRAYRYGQTKPVYVYRLITFGTYEHKVFINSVHKMGLSFRVVDQKNPERKFTREDLNSKFLVTPEANMPTKLPAPECINYDDDVLVSVALEHRQSIIDIQKVSSFFIDDSQDLNEDDKKHAQELLIEEKAKLSLRIN
ncbi:16285_t:CDS:10 [Funneliformis geosporum]|nr:16285_t:CDS:10 [Funneliformis geosporum]